MGPTAAGKTSLAIELAQIFPFEIISVDSGMIYRGMDIGTAKPTCQELAAAPHRLIDICDPSENYSAGQFRNDAIEEIEKILSLGKVPLLVGGTMLYFRVLQQGISKLPRANREVRSKLAVQAEEIGLDGLYRLLKKIDPQTAANISQTDSQRIQRALEVFELTGRSLSELQRASPPQTLPCNVTNIAITPFEKTNLYTRINQRFQKMLRLGFLDEVEQLYKREDLYSDLPSMRLVGYRQAMQYFAGKINYEQMLEQIPIVTRQLAKRQMTWLKGWSKVKWFDSTSRNLFVDVKQIIHV